MDGEYRYRIRVRKKSPPIVIKIPKEVRERLRSLFSEETKEVVFDVTLRPVKVVKEVVLDE